MLTIQSSKPNTTTFKSKITNSKFAAEKLANLSIEKSSKNFTVEIFDKIFPSFKPQIKDVKTTLNNKIQLTTSNKLAEQKAKMAIELIG